MANLASSVLQVVMLLAVSRVLKVIIVVQEAALVARVVNQRLEAANVGVKQSRHNRLCHCIFSSE